MKLLGFFLGLVLLVPASLFAGTFDDRLWDDGYAEWDEYEASRIVYGKARPHSVVMIVVKEDLDPSKYVKSDNPGPGSIPVLKLNYSARLETENYPYDFFASVFVERSNTWKIAKEAANTHEYCGTTQHFLRGWLHPAELEWRSYFDGEADGVERFNLSPDFVMEDQLMLCLRDLPFAEGYTKTIQVVPTLLSNRHLGKPARKATVRVGKKETVPGTQALAWRVDVEYEKKKSNEAWAPMDNGESGTDTYWVGADAPHLLYRMETADGRTLRLRSTERVKYWLRPKIVKPAT